MNQSEVLGINAASRQARASKAKLSHIRIEAAENGGHIVEHHFEHDGGPYREPKQHVFGKGEHGEMLQHVSKALHLPTTTKGEAEEEHDEEGIAEE